MRDVNFSIQELFEEIVIQFDNRVLSLPAGSSCSIKVSLAAKIVLYGSRFSEPDTTKDNGDPTKNGSDSEIKEIDDSYKKMLDELISPSSSGDATKKSILDAKRLKIIDAIKEVCKDCCCNMTAEQYCIQPTDISEAVKDVCKDCCCKSKDPCVDSSKIMDEVKKLCQNCCCKKDDCCNIDQAIKEIDEFCACEVKQIKEKLVSCKCSGCSACKDGDCCFDKQKLIEGIEKLCCCDQVKNAFQSCTSCSGSSGTCQCCKEKIESCQCKFCTAKKEIESLAGSSAQCCSDPGCSCSTNGGKCIKKAEIEQKLNGLCQCKTELNSIKQQVEDISQNCKQNKCKDAESIKGDIERICKTCDCRKSDCCNEDKIKEKAQEVIKDSCKCRTAKCCFRDVNTGDLSSNKAEKEKLKKIALTIFKYFRPPIAHSTGVMTLKSTTDIELEFLSSSSNEKITVDSKNNNALKIPKQAFKSLMASAKMHENKVKDFHPNSMLSIKFEEICLTFQEFTGTGFCIDGYSINGSFSMQLGYLPAGIFTRNSANWRRKTEENSNKKHDLSWSIGQPLIDPSKCSCSILSDPLFGTVFGAICLTISIVQFIIALFVSQGYYDGFQSYMDAVRSGFSWPTQYDNVVNSVFWWFGLGVRNGSRLLLGMIYDNLQVVRGSRGLGFEGDWY
ncbi:hypothetical protein BdWA1_002257, partial [Babesia duncani]